MRLSLHHDLDHLRGHSSIIFACGHLPDTDHDPASQPIPSRLENAPGLRDVICLRYALVDDWMDGYALEPGRVTIGIDDTCDVVHGRSNWCFLTRTMMRAASCRFTFKSA